VVEAGIVPGLAARWLRAVAATVDREPNFAQLGADYDFCGDASNRWSNRPACHRRLLLMSNRGGHWVAGQERNHRLGDAAWVLLFERVVRASEHE
jgi:hypothetical protein